MNDQARAFLIVAALLSGASGSVGFVGGRMSVPVPPAEVRYVQVSVPAVVAAPPPADVVIEPAVVPVAPAAPIEPPVEVKPPPPKVDAKPKATIKPKPEAKPRPPAQKKSLPSCAFIKAEYERMTWVQRVAAYQSATAEEIAHGKHCKSALGF